MCSFVAVSTAYFVPLTGDEDSDGFGQAPRRAGSKVQLSCFRKAVELFVDQVRRLADGESERKLGVGDEAARKNGRNDTELPE